MSARAAGLLAGSLADLWLGDPRRGHPVAGFGRVAAHVEAGLWRDERRAGTVHCAVLVAVPTLLACAAGRKRGPLGRAVATAAATWTALGARSLWREAAAVAAAVAADDLEEARRRLPALVGRDPSGLDAGELARAVVESVAENTADAVVAPLLFAAVLGAPGVVAHRCANTLDAMVGHRSPRYERFGWAAARLDDALAWLPARATAALAAVLAPVVGGSPRVALQTWRRDGGKHPSPNAGRAEAAFAGALGLRLGGTVRYGERVEVRGPLGEGRPPEGGDVGQAIRLSQAVASAAAILSAGLAAALGRRPVREPGPAAGWRVAA